MYLVYRSIIVIIAWICYTHDLTYTSYWHVHTKFTNTFIHMCSYMLMLFTTYWDSTYRCNFSGEFCGMVLPLSPHDCPLSALFHSNPFVFFFCNSCYCQHCNCECILRPLFSFQKLLSDIEAIIMREYFPAFILYYIIFFIVRFKNRFIIKCRVSS